MRILVVDDHEVVRRGVRHLLESENGLEVCGEAIDGHDAIAKARHRNPDAIVMDNSMPNTDALLPLLQRFEKTATRNPSSRRGRL